MGLRAAERCPSGREIGDSYASTFYGQTDKKMDTIRLCVRDPGRRRQLFEALDADYRVEDCDRSGDDPFSPADLLVLDLATFQDVGTDGIERYRAQEPNVASPVLLLAARPRLSRLDPAVWEHVDEVIGAPVRRAELKGRVRALLRLRRYAKEAEDAREQISSKYKALFDSSALGILLLEDEEIREANARASGLLEAAPEALVGRTLADLSPPRLPEGTPSAEAVEALLREARADGEAHTEWRFDPDSGDPFWAELTLSPVSDDEDECVQIAFRDVTEQKERQDELRQQRNLLEQAQRLAGAWEVDLQTDETSWSDKVYEIHEVEPGTEVGVEEAIEFYAPEARPKIREAFERCIEEREPYDLELPLITEEGNHRWVRTVGAPVEESDGSVVKVAGAFQDITDRKQAEARFRLQAHILQQVAKGASLRRVLADLVEGIEEQQPGMLGSVQLYDSEEGRIRHGAAPNLPDAYNEAIDGEEIGPSAGSCGTAMHTRSKVVAEDVTEDPRWRDYRDLALSHDLRACWSTPILSSEDEVLGSFAMYYREPQSPTEADEALIEVARSLARIAIERHRNEQNLRKERDRFATLFHNLPTPVVYGRAEEDDTIHVRSVNETFERVFGVEASAIEGRDLDEYVVPEDRQEEAAEINRRVLEEEGYQAEVQRETADGMRVFRLQVASRTVEDGPTDVYAIYTDVTEERRRYRRRQRQQEALLDLTNDERVVSGEFDAAIRKITERAAEVLDVARVNVWLFEEEGRLHCEDHYERPSGEHAAGMELVPREYPSYVEALSEHRVIEASDARSDPRTSELEEDYLRPHDIGALLDATLHSEGEVIGVVCCEHVGGSREWATDEIQFAGEVADVVHRTLRNREQAEQRRELAFQQSLLKAQQEAVLDGMLVVDEEVEVVSYNDRFLKMWGFSEELPEQGGEAAMLDWANDQVRDSEAFWETVDYLYEHPDERGRDEVELADGRVFDQYSTPLEGEDGTHYGRLWTFRDVTEQKRREERHRGRRRKIEALYEATSRLLEAKSRTAVSDRIHDVLQDVFDYPFNNTGFLEGERIAPEETRTVEKTQVPSPVPQPIEADSVSARALRAGDTVVDEAVGSLENSIDYGELSSVAGVPIGAHGVIVVGVVGERSFEQFDLRLIEVLAGYAALVLDRLAREDELIEAKEAAEEASRLKSAMLANMSHEIRTPLTSITGFAEILKGELEGQPAEFVRKIHKGGRRLMKTLDSVLQLAKLEAGVYEMDREAVSLRDVAEETAEMLRLAAEEKSIALKADLPEAPVRGTWNEGALNRIAGNLLENAIKFTPEGGTVEVRVRAEENEAVLEVEDTGVGIGEEALPDIFQAFKQESEGLDREYEGSGLGLSIVKELTEALGGEITVESEKGVGTRFTLVLPQAPASTRQS